MLSAIKRNLICGGAAAFLASGALCLPAAAAVFVSPVGQPPSVAANIRYGRLGNVNPWGQPAEADCTWSRIQIPTSNGLQWVAERECNSNRF